MQRVSKNLKEFLIFLKNLLHFLSDVGITATDFALVAELVDAADLKSVGRKAVPVRFRPSAPFKKAPQRGCFFCYVNLLYITLVFLYATFVAI